MNLNVSSSAGNKPAFTSQSNSNSAVEALEKVKMQLQDQLKQVNESKGDAKTKAEKIKTINEQISQIDQQIQQAKMEAQQEKIQEAAAKNAAQTAKRQQEDDASDTGVVIAASLSQLVFADNKTAQLHSLHQVQTRLSGQMNVSEIEIKQNAAAHGSSTYQLKSIADNSSQLAKTTQMIGSNVRSVQKAEKAVDEAVKDVADSQNSVKANVQDSEKEADGKLSTTDDSANKITKKHPEIDIFV